MWSLVLSTSTETINGILCPFFAIKSRSLFYGKEYGIKYNCILASKKFHSSSRNKPINCSTLAKYWNIMLLFSQISSTEDIWAEYTVFRYTWCMLFRYGAKHRCFFGAKLYQPIKFHLESYYEPSSKLTKNKPDTETWMCFSFLVLIWLRIVLPSTFTCCSSSITENNSLQVMEVRLYALIRQNHLFSVVRCLRL